MIFSAYKSQNSWNFYVFFVFDQNTSENICDALLIVFETMKRFKSDIFMSKCSFVKLNHHINQQIFKFFKNDISDFLKYFKNLYKNFWNFQFTTNTFQKLKCSMKKITIKFVENFINSFSESSKSWTYISNLFHDVFKKIAINFENFLNKKYDNRR